MTKEELELENESLNQAIGEIQEENENLKKEIQNIEKERGDNFWFNKATELEKKILALKGLVAVL